MIIGGPACYSSSLVARSCELSMSFLTFVTDTSIDMLLCMRCKRILPPILMTTASTAMQIVMPRHSGNQRDRRCAIHWPPWVVCWYHCSHSLATTTKSQALHLPRILLLRMLRFWDGMRRNITAIDRVWDDMALFKISLCFGAGELTFAAWEGTRIDS